MISSQMVHDKETGCLCLRPCIRVLRPPTSWVIPIFRFHIHQVVFPTFIMYSHIISLKCLATCVPCAEPVSDRRNLVGYLFVRILRVDRLSRIKGMCVGSGRMFTTPIEGGGRTGWKSGNVNCTCTVVEPVQNNIVGTGVGIELERLLNQAWSYTGPF